ncbi:MAG: hypothetical protein JST00_03230 [Deltaproteobacteria bacterium]|nr:hypothetical protein [Deltaproteobacteria bacterium]
MAGDRDAFATTFQAALRDRGEARTSVYDAARFAIELQGEGGNDVFFLANAFAEHEAAAPGDRPAVIARWVAFASGMRVPPAESLDEALVNLLPRVRERSSFSLAALEIELQLTGRDDAALAKLRETGLASPHRAIAGAFAAGLCHDTPTTVIDVGGAQLAEWTLDFDTAFELAMTNLRRGTTKVAFEEVAPGVWQSPWRDSFDATRILLEDVYRDVPVKGDPVVFTIQPGVVVVAGSDDLDGLAIALGFAAEAMDQPRFMGAFPIRLGASGWAPFEPALDHPLGLDLWKLRIMARSGAYEAQKALLDALFEKQGRQVFVAKHTAMMGEGGVIVYSAWADSGEVTALPETETLLLGKPGKMYRASFARAREVMGDAMTPMEGVYPPRHLATRFPSDEELARIGAEELKGA